MYPASAVESGQITFDDLPDTVLNVFDFSFSKTGPITYTVEDKNYTLYYGVESEGIGISEGSGSWSFQQDFGIGAENSCLFSEPSVSIVYDNFEDAYTVFDPVLVFPEVWDGTQIATRESLCIWAGDGGLNLVQEAIRNIWYNGQGSNGYPFPELPPDVWLIQLGEGGTFRLKTGPDQSSPVGDYEGGITVY